LNPFQNKDFGSKSRLQRQGLSASGGLSQKIILRWILFLAMPMPRKSLESISKKKPYGRNG
jgi:hypothetical protein